MTNKNIQKKSHRVMSLEGMRGFFAMIVVFHHFAAAFYPAIIFGSMVAAHSRIERVISSTPLNIFFDGNFAVTIFFVLSGYALSYGYYNIKKFGGLQEMALKRYFRLMIPILGSVFIAYILLKLNLFFNMKISDTTLSSVWLGQYYNFKPDFLKMLYEGTIGIFTDPMDWTYNNVIWIMYYELTGSFIVLGFLALLGSAKSRYYAYIALTIFLFKTYTLGMILGVISCDIERQIKNSSKVFDSARYLSFILLPISIYLGTYQGGNQSALYGFLNIPWLTIGQNISLYHTIAGFIFFNTVLYTKWLARFFTNRIFLFLGKISFSIYLLHVIVIFSFSSFIFYMLRPYLNFEYNINFFLTFILSIALIVPLAYIYNKYIIENVINLSKNIRISKDSYYLFPLLRGKIKVLLRYE